jgi:hypothetical protein
VSFLFSVLRVWRPISSLVGRLFFVSIPLAGCIGPQTVALRESPPPVVPRIELAQTHFFPQEAFHCGPAALATALSSAGVAVDPDQLVPQVYLPERRGSLQVEMLAAARRNGTIPFRLDLTLASLLTEIENGHPVVVLQNLGLSWAPRWHYAVVIGYDLPRQELILRSGSTRRLVTSMRTFEHTWKRGGHWAIVAAAPGRIPVTANEHAYIDAVIAFEKVAHASQAEAAFAAAADRWRGNMLAWIGAGNNAFLQQKWHSAEQAFRRAAELAPDSAAAALNNLALALAELNRLDEAVDVARKAVDLGGRFESISRATLQDLLDRRAAHTME